MASEGRRHTAQAHCSQGTRMRLLQVRYTCFQNIPYVLHDPLNLILLDVTALTVHINMVEADILVLVELCRTTSVHVASLTPVVLQEASEGRRITDQIQCR